MSKSYFSAQPASPRRLATAAQTFELAAELIEPHRTESWLDFSPKGDPTRVGIDETYFKFTDCSRLGASALAARECIEDYQLEDEPGHPFVIGRWSHRFKVASLKAPLRSLILGQDAVNLFANLNRPVRTFAAEAAPTAHNITNIAINLEPPEERIDPLCIANIYNPMNLFTGRVASPGMSVIYHLDAVAQGSDPNVGSKRLDLTEEQLDHHDELVRDLLAGLKSE